MGGGGGGQALSEKFHFYFLPFPESLLNVSPDIVNIEVFNSPTFILLDFRQATQAPFGTSWKGERQQDTKDRDEESLTSSVQRLEQYWNPSQGK